MKKDVLPKSKTTGWSINQHFLKPEVPWGVFQQPDKREQGLVLGSTIDKYVYVSVNRNSRFFDYTTRVSYRRTELARALTTSSIQASRRQGVPEVHAN